MWKSPSDLLIKQVIPGQQFSVTESILLRHIGLSFTRSYQGQIFLQGDLSSEYCGTAPICKEIFAERIEWSIE